MMTAASSTPMINGNNDVGKEPNAEHSPSRFTAVNGKEPLTSGACAPIPVSGSPTTNDERHREASESWRRSGYNTPMPEETLLKGSSDVRNDQEDTRFQLSSSQCEVSTIKRSKRKRSGSGGQQQICQASSQAPGGSIALVSHLGDSVDLGVPPSNPSATTVSDSDYQTQETSLSTLPSRNEDVQALSADSRWQEYKSRLVSTSQSAQQIDPSDAHLAEALQREALETCQKNLDVTKRPMDGLVLSDQPTYPRERPPGAVQVAPKRKRVFSNRTKTGCMTCRRRKKKCDEQHPTCNNCIRGGFLCEGYSSRGVFPRLSTSKTAVPLQSKEGYPEAGSQYIHDRHGGQRSLVERPDAGKLKSTVVNESDHVTSQYIASPIEANCNHGPWIKRSWTGPGHPAYISEHVAKSETREAPLIHEISRGGPPKTDFPVVAPLRESQYVVHSKPTVPVLQSGMEQRPLNVISLGSSSPQTQARTALSIEQQMREETEKDKMLRGDLYQPFDIHLVEERSRCKAALWRFNNACNTIFGSSAKEQNRLLKEVLVPPANSAVSSPSGVAPPHSGGSIGQGAVVIGPFECHYGYNIHIGEDVMISEACRFVDDCHINIGAHTWIGPGVTILSSMAHPSMQERKGSQSRYQGRPVTIEEDCYVGANCTIYPGVRIRRGAYVAPGEVVKADIVAYGFQGFKPSYM